MVRVEIRFRKDIYEEDNILLFWHNFWYQFNDLYEKGNYEGGFDNLFDTELKSYNAIVIRYSSGIYSHLEFESEEDAIALILEFS